VSRTSNHAGWWLVAALVLAAIALYLLRSILLPFVVAAGLAYVVSPLVAWQHQSLHFPRPLAIFLVYFVVLCVMAGTGYWLGPPLLRDINTLLSKSHEDLATIVAELIGTEHITVLGYTIDVTSLVQFGFERARGFLGLGVGPEVGLGRLFGAAITFTGGVLLTLVVLAYFLVDGERLIRGIVHVVPPDRRTRALFIIERVDRVLGRYLRGLLVLITYAAVSSWLVLQFVFHLPYAIPIAILTGLLELVPFLGPVTSWALASIVALLHGGVWLMLAVVIFYGLLRLTLDPFLGPIVLGRAVTVPPVVILFSLLAGGALLGILGVLLAIPVVATIRVVLESLYMEHDKE